MTGTFHFTGKILDKSKAPLVRAQLVLSSNPKMLRDPSTQETYSPPPRVTTDDAGYLCVADAAGVPSATRGVDLVVGVQYRLWAKNRMLMDPIGWFTAPDAGTTLDITGVPDPEPEDLPPTWADIIADLEARIAELEANGGGSGTPSGTFPSLTTYPSLTLYPIGA